MTTLCRGRLFVAVALVVLAAGASAQEPSWPQQFKVLQGEGAAFGFAVSQPGPISVNVTVQGAPVSVELSGPIAQPMRKSGTGAINITIAATAADVQKSAIWIVRISPVNLAKPAPNQAPQVVATGTISVQHPPGKVSIAQRPAAHRVTAAPHTAAMAGTPNSALISAYLAQLAAKQNAEQQRLQHMVSAAPVAANTGRPQVKRLSVGPAIDSISVTHGQPGDFLLIHGHSLGDRGEVHFIVNPGMDVTAPPNPWTDNAVMVRVPSVTGIGGYSGQLYLKTTGQHPAKTNSVRFDFQPDTDFVDLAPWETQPDAHIDQTDIASVCDQNGVCRDGSTDFLFRSGDDVWYATTKLENGWIVYQVSASVTEKNGFEAFAWPWDFKEGSSYPYAKVHWRMDPFTSFKYAIVVIIKGPKGTTYY